MRAGWIVAALLLAGCHQTTDPAEQLVLAISAEPLTAAIGENVRFIASAYNPTSSAIELVGPCGPSLDVMLNLPNGADVSLLIQAILGGGAFTCELGPQHVVQPGETERLQLTWRASVTGNVRAHAVLRPSSSVRSRPLDLSIE